MELFIKVFFFKVISGFPDFPNTKLSIINLVVQSLVVQIRHAFLGTLQEGCSVIIVLKKLYKKSQSWGNNSPPGIAEYFCHKIFLEFFSTRNTRLPLNELKGKSG